MAFGIRKLRMARIGDVALLEKPAENRSPKRIDCYQITEHSADGAAFKLDPARLVYSLRWLHKAEPPDYELVLLRGDPELWQRRVNGANLPLRAELRRRAPHAIDWAAMGDVVALLDAFEAARESGTAHRH